MKILALRLANLASLPGPLALDFTAEPLASAGLFAITGPTGAGKSTLLDALCLALYGNTPRLRQAPNRDSQVDDPAGQSLTTSDPRTLLRRGTASGHAEVDFLGRDGHRYRARWAVRRARDKADGRLQSVDQSLRDLDDDRLLTNQKREFDKLLPERLGLTFEQFTRAVLLAQSEFAAFLKADDNERSDLLERLTGTAEYSAISRAAYRRASEARKGVETLEAKLADDLPAEPQARAELEQQAASAHQALADLQQRQDRLDARQRWHDTDDRLSLAVAEGRHQQQQADAGWRELAAARADREWRRLILPQRHRLARQAALPGDIATLETTHAATLESLRNSETTCQQASQAHTAAEHALHDATEARRRADPRLREARDQAQQLAGIQQQLAEREATQAERQRQRVELDTQHRQARAEHHERRQQRDARQATLTQLMGEHPRLEDARQATQRQLDQAARRHLALEELASRWRQVRHATETQRRLADQLSDDERRLATLLEQGQNARRRLDERHNHYASISAVIERSRAVRSESVARLREGLQEDEPCPVCGGLDHPWRHHPPPTPEATQLAAQQAEEERQLNEAQAALDQARQARDNLVGEYRALEAALKQRRQDAQTAEQQHNEARQALNDHPLHAELDAIEDAERDAWLAAQRDASEAARAHHQRILNDLAKAEAELAPLERALQQDELVLARFESRREALDKELAELAERLPPLRSQRDDIARQLQAQLGEHASPDAWQQSLDDRQAQAHHARDAALSRLHEARQEAQRLAQQRDHERQRLETLHQERDTLDHELAEWRRAHPELDDATLTRLLDQSDDEAQRLEQQLDDAERARQQADATLAERRQALLAHRRDQGLTEDDESDEDDAALLGESAEARLRERREALASEREALAPRLEDAQRQRDDAQHALRDDDRKRARQQQGQAELEAARTEYRRWGRISELIGSADGKTFRRIAQAYNLEQLLEHANAHLTGLSRRYRLVRGGSELGLLVVDRDMGDERRSVHSLSGGETFLVSLALALGLASMASGELTIESLFIDEGFGSLDPDSLALAMEALDGLQALGRRVGVISHVQEMHERIPVQIHVAPIGNGTSRATLVNA
ncbi:AAA family ATPase [Halomonas caseinilytica]|uniref:Nuclease SbcCD subunit C n=1 Tax=Halomonas caseinilytica TaxID=438744 RepID=A0A1M6MUJ6_9GAMM|nr:AAA family ATPase [Halomonas caseinilytica]SHJ87185.1 exonuclease SbcC [Halomonas caseinilytica]